MKELITKEIEKRAKELRKEEAYRLGVMEERKRIRENIGKVTIKSTEGEDYVRLSGLDDILKDI